MLHRMHFESGDQLIAFVSRQTGDTCLLSFSSGKDSVVSWLKLRPHFKRVLPFLLYRHPRLSFMLDAVHYYEDFFQQEITLLPHPRLWMNLMALVYQVPQNVRVVQEHQLHHFDYDDCSNFIRKKYNVPDAFGAIGVRSADSPYRMLTIKKNGPVNYQRQTFYPIFDMRIADIEREILAANIKLPYDYKMFGRTFDGMDHRFMAPLKEHLPKDYERMLSLFPMAEMSSLRRTWPRPKQPSMLEEL
jgi:hypothetical protein